MKYWHIKELSNLTGISVQSLHYYDRIDLLTPHTRRQNNYRIYSEKELLKLQRIIALKFFGFSLEEIKQSLTNDYNISEGLIRQADALKQKARNLQRTSNRLEQILKTHNDSNEELWTTIINVIEVYNMMEKEEYKWAQELLTEQELTQYSQLEHVKNKQNAHAKQRTELLELTQKHLSSDPTSNTGSQIAKQWMDMINAMYGEENANLKHKIWNEGFKKGKITGKGHLSPEIIQWLDQAVSHYYRTRLLAILKQIDTGTNLNPISEWDMVMREMFGNDLKLKQDFLQMAIADAEVSNSAKKWLKAQI